MRSGYLNTPTDQAQCPLCAATKGSVLWRVSSSQAAQHFVLRSSDPQRHAQLMSHIEALWHGETCSVIRCEQCAFVYAYPYVAGDREFYGLAYRRSGYPAWKWEHEQALRMIESDVKKRGLNAPSLLEVGAGNGVFIKGVSPRLIATRDVLCLEFSEYGCCELGKCGVEAMGQDLLALDEAAHKGRFDYACMFQVFEHMDRNHEVMAKLSAVTSHGALLFISVPDPQRTEFNETHGCLLDMPPNHIGRWDASSLELLGKRHGWQVIDLSTDSAGFFKRALIHAKYRYLRQTQTEGSLANAIESNERLPMRGALRGAGAAICGLTQPLDYFQMNFALTLLVTMRKL